MKYSEREYLFLRAKVDGMTLPEKLHRLAQLTDFDEWIRVAKEWLTKECLADGKDKLCS